MLLRTLLLTLPLFASCASTCRTDDSSCCETTAGSTTERAAEPAVRVVSLEFAHAPTLAETLQNLLHSGRTSRRASGSDIPVRVIADRRTNSLLISASEEDLEMVLKLTASLDVEVPSAGSQ